MSNDTPTNDDLMKIYADNCPFVRPFLALDIPTPDEPFDDEERQHWHLIGTDLRSAVTKPITLTAGWSVTQAKIAECAKYMTRVLLNGLTYPGGRVLPKIPGTLSPSIQDVNKDQMVVKLPAFDHAGNKFGGPYYIFKPEDAGTFYGVEVIAIDSFRHVRIAGFYRHP